MHTSALLFLLLGSGHWTRSIFLNRHRGTVSIPILQMKVEALRGETSPAPQMANDGAGVPAGAWALEHVRTQGF